MITINKKVNSLGRSKSKFLKNSYKFFQARSCSGRGLELYKRKQKAEKEKDCKN